MSFRSIVRDVRDGFGSLSRRSFDVRLLSHHRGKSHSSVHELQEQPPVIQNSRWASLPPELLHDVIKRLEESESMWPARKHVVACAAVCKSWREMCKEIVSNPEFCGKITFPVSLKQVRYLWSFIPHLRYVYIQFLSSWKLLIFNYLCDFVLQPGPRDGMIQCFIKRDKSNLTYHLFLCLSPGKPMFWFC